MLIRAQYLFTLLNFFWSYQYNINETEEVKPLDEINSVLFFNGMVTERH